MSQGMCGKQWGELPDDQDVGNRLISLVYMYMYTVRKREHIKLYPSTACRDVFSSKCVG